MQVPSESMVQRAIRAFHESSAHINGASPLKRGVSPLAGTADLGPLHEPRQCSAPPTKHSGPQTQASSPHTYVPGPQMSSSHHAAAHSNVSDAASPGRHSNATDEGHFISPTGSMSLSATSSQISSLATGAAVTASSLGSSAVPSTPAATSRSSRSPKATFARRVQGCVPVCGASGGPGQAAPSEGGADMHTETIGTSASTAADSAALEAVRPRRPNLPRPGVVDRVAGNSGTSTRGLSDGNHSSCSLTRDVATSSALWNKETLDSAWEDMLARRRAGIARCGSADHICLEDVECAVRESFINCSASSELGDFEGGDSAIAVEKTMAHLRHLLYTIAQSAPSEPPQDINSPAAFAAALHYRLRHYPPTNVPSPRAHAVAVAAARSLSPNDCNSMPLQTAVRPQAARVTRGPQTSPSVGAEPSEAQSTPRSPRSPPPRPFLVPVLDRQRHKKKGAHSNSSAAAYKAPQQRQVQERRTASRSPVQVPEHVVKPREKKEPKEPPPTSPPLPSRSTRRRAQDKARAVAAAAVAEEASSPAAGKGGPRSPPPQRQHTPMGAPKSNNTKSSPMRSDSKHAATAMSPSIFSHNNRMSVASRRAASPPSYTPPTRTSKSTPPPPKSLQCPSSGGESSNIQAGPDVPRYWSPNAVPSVGSNAILMPAHVPKPRTPASGRHPATSLSPKRQTSATSRGDIWSPMSAQRPVSPRRMNAEPASPAGRRAALQDAFSDAAHTPFHLSPEGGPPQLHVSRHRSVSPHASLCDVDLSPVASSAMVPPEFQTDTPAWETRFYNSSYVLPASRGESVNSSDGSHHVRQPRTHLRAPSVCSSVNSRRGGEVPFSRLPSHCDSHGPVSTLSDDFHEAENGLMNGASGRQGSSVFNTLTSLCSITAAVRLSSPSSNRTLSPSSAPQPASGSMSNPPSTVSFNFNRNSQVVPSSHASAASVGSMSDMHAHSTRPGISAALSESTSATTTPRLQSTRPHSAHSIHSATEVSYPAPLGPNSISSLDLSPESSLRPGAANMYVREVPSEAATGPLSGGYPVSPRPPLPPSSGGMRSASAPSCGPQSRSDSMADKGWAASEAALRSAADYYKAPSQGRLPASITGYTTSASPATPRSDGSVASHSSDPYSRAMTTGAPQSTSSTSSTANTAYGHAHPHSGGSNNQPPSYGSTPSQHVHGTLDSGGEPLRGVVSSDAPYEQKGDENIRISALDLNTPPSPTTQRLLSSPRLNGASTLPGVGTELAGQQQPLANCSPTHGQAPRGSKHEDCEMRMSAFVSASDITVGSRPRGGLGGLERGSSLTSSVPSMSPLSPQASFGQQEAPQATQRIPRAPPAVPIWRHQYNSNPPERSSLTPRRSTTARTAFEPRSPRSHTLPLPQATASASAVPDPHTPLSPPRGARSASTAPLHRSSVVHSPASPKFHTAARARSRVTSATAPVKRPGRGRPGAGQSPGRGGSKAAPAGLNPRLFAPTESFARKVTTGGPGPRSRVVSDNTATAGLRNMNVGPAAAATPPLPRGSGAALLSKASFSRRKGLNSKFGRGTAYRNAAGSAAEPQNADEEFLSVAEHMNSRRSPTNRRLGSNRSNHVASAVDNDRDTGRFQGSNGTISQDFRPSEYHEIDRDQDLDRLMNDHMHENMHETLRSPHYDQDQAAAAATALEAANLHNLAALSTVATTLSPTFPDRVLGSSSESHPGHVDAKAFDRGNLFHGADDSNTVDPLMPEPSTDEQMKPGDAGTPPIPGHMREGAGRGPTSSSSAKMNTHDSPKGDANMSFSAAVHDQIARHRQQSGGGGSLQSPSTGSRADGGVPGVEMDTSYSPSMSYDDTDLDDLSQTSSVMYWDSNNPDNAPQIRSASARSRRSRRSRGRNRGPTSSATASEPVEPPQPREDSAAEPSDAPPVVDCSGTQLQSQFSGGSMNVVPGPCAEPAGYSSAWNSASFGGGPALRPTDSLMSARGHSESTSKNAKDFSFGMPLSFQRQAAADTRSQSIDEVQTVEWWANANGNSMGDTSKATVVSVEPPAAAYGRVDPIRRQLMEQASSQGRAYLMSHPSSSVTSVSGSSSKGNSSRMGGAGTGAAVSANVQDAPYSSASKGGDSQPAYTKERGDSLLSFQIQDPQVTRENDPQPGQTVVPTDSCQRISWWRRNFSCMLCQARQ